MLLALGAGYALLAAVNPVADEWQCSDREAPANGRAGGVACFTEGTRLPAGWTWDPWGNRPLSSNCDKGGWTAVANRAQGETDCVRAGTRLPAGWSVSRD